MSVYDLARWQPADRVEELCQQDESCEGFILKLGEPDPETHEIVMDPMFVTHVNNVVAQGKPYGIYFISRARNLDEMMQEVQWVNDTVAEYLNGVTPELGTWFDLERDEVKRDDIADNIFAAVDTLNQWWTTNRIGIYASYSYFTDYIGLDELIQRQTPVWLARYADTDPMQGSGVREILWQFTTHDKKQDENIYYGW